MAFATLEEGGAAFGLWTNRGEHGLAYQCRVIDERGEWEHSQKPIFIDYLNGIDDARRENRFYQKPLISRSFRLL